MSQENVEKLLQIYELVNERFAELKAGDLDPFLEFFAADVVIEMMDTPDPGRYVGHDGVRQWFDAVYGPWDAVHVETEGIIQSGGWTIAQLHCTLRGEASGVELELPITGVHQFRDGRIVRDRLYLDREEALESVGLSE
jgi:ketosteroid isomerase-like protein